MTQVESDNYPVIMISPSVVMVALALAISMVFSRAAPGPVPPQIFTHPPATQPSYRPSDPPMFTHPPSISSICQTNLVQLYNQTTSCFDQIPSQINQTFKSSWCSNTGCRGMIRNNLTTTLDKCGQNDGVQSLISTVSQRVQNMVQYLCPAQDTCSDDTNVLLKVAKQGAPTSDILSSVCQPCALKSLGEQARVQMMVSITSSANQVVKFNQIAQSKVVCDTVNGTYCSPAIMAFDGSKPEKLCSLCFRKYFAKMAFTLNSTTDNYNPYKRLGSLLYGGCIRDVNDQPCIKTIVKYFNITAPMLANLSSQAPVVPLPACNSRCDTDCTRFLSRAVIQAGNCSAAIKPLMKFLGVNISDSCFNSVNISTPPTTKTRLKWVITTNDTAANICSQLKLDMSTSFGMDTAQIKCRYKMNNTMFVRRLLSNTQTVTTTTTDYSTSDTSSQSTFVADTLNGQVSSVSTDNTTTITTTMMSKKATARLSQFPSSSPYSPIASPSTVAPTPSTSANRSAVSGQDSPTPSPTSQSSSSPRSSSAPTGSSSAPISSTTVPSSATNNFNRFKMIPLLLLPIIALAL